VALHELLLGRFPYRLIPKLPPKKMVGGKYSCFVKGLLKVVTVDSLFVSVILRAVYCQ
jgi:hypothetical protein